MTLLEFLQGLPQEYHLKLDYFFESLSTGEEELDEEYSYEGNVGDYESSMEGYSFQFDFKITDFFEVKIEGQKRKVYMKWLAYCD